MSNRGMLIATLAALVAMLWLTQRWQHGKGGLITLALARLLRRMGRWLWALGEAVEVGYFHGRKVRDGIRLELETVSKS
ncbi:MAG: hypothetical protein FJW34_02100 [Acidobacteria bacterium]|nr:hypothetical protein [Acidobacteriota bacterium]